LAQLDGILRRAPLVMEALRAARDVDPPDWLIAAGAIRDAVWDLLHDREPAPPKDVDLAYFAGGGLTDDAVEAALRHRAPAIPWEARNQADVHLWYPRRFGFEVPPFASSADAIATFPEVASCVGVRLLPDDSLDVVAPHGLDDLLGIVCRHNPTRVSAGFYEQRVQSHDWRARWPRMRYVPA
jgi:hypothetical protein